MRMDVRSSLVFTSLIIRQVFPRKAKNNYSVTVASGAAVAENGNAAVKQTKTHQYYTEASNVDVANEMVNLIVAQRAYEMNSKAIQASDEMMQQANALR